MKYKDKNYANLEELKYSISAECNKISVYQLTNIRREFYELLGHCLGAIGEITVLK